MMKAIKYILPAFVCLAAFSCSRDAVPQIGDAQDSEIMFRTNVVPMGKSIVMSEDDLTTESMSLYGWNLLAGHTEPTFAINNLPLKYANGAWDYAPHQYWMSSAFGYGFAAIWPYCISRNDPKFVPTADDPALDAFHSDDIVRNIIVHVRPYGAYLSNAMRDVMVGYKDVARQDYGKTVNLPMRHSLCAFRFRVRNLTGQTRLLMNYYMTNLKCHSDLCAVILGGNADGDNSQVMTRIPDDAFVDLIHAPVGEVGTKDQIKIKTTDGTADGQLSLTGTETDWILCEDDANTTNNYRFIVISQKLNETATDDADAAAKIEGIKAKYAAAGYTNYSKNIYWGSATGKGMFDNHFFMPFAYYKDATIFDFDADGIRGNQGDYDRNIRVYESKNSLSGQKPNGGIVMPNSSEYEANLYSPYFFSAENHSAVAGDWKEGNGALAAGSSIFSWTTVSDPVFAPSDIAVCCDNYKNSRGAEYYTTSVKGGDLKNVLNDNGYVLAFPQDISNLVLHLTTYQYNTNNGNVVASTDADTFRSVNLADFTQDHRWRPGYLYDYVVTVSSGTIQVSLDVEPWKDRNINLQ